MITPAEFATHLSLGGQISVTNSDQGMDSIHKMLPIPDSVAFSPSLSVRNGLLRGSVAKPLPVLEWKSMGKEG